MLTVNTADACRCVSRDVPSEIRWKSSRMTLRCARPAAVITSRWHSRLNTVKPSAVSRPYLIVDRALRHKEFFGRARKTFVAGGASNAFRALNDGSRCSMNRPEDHEKTWGKVEKRCFADQSREPLHTGPDETIFRRPGHGPCP